MPERLKGLDISHWERPGHDLPDFHGLWDQGFRFMITKLTDGLHGVDPTGKDYVARAQSVGMLAGYFHFLQPGNGRAQADHFLDTAGDMAGMLIPFDDDEVAGTSTQTNIDFRDRVKERIGVTPGYYSMLSRIQARHGLTDMPLWAAHPDGGVSAPTNLGDWNQFVIWQDSFTPFDRDAFFGDMDALRQFTIGAIKPTDGLGIVVFTPAEVWKLVPCRPVLDDVEGKTIVDYAPICHVYGIDLPAGLPTRGPIRDLCNARYGLQVTAHLDQDREYVYPLPPVSGFPKIAVGGQVTS